MTTLQELQLQLQKSPQKWLVTGCAGFIGSHLVEQLIAAGQRVIGIDNFSTGDEANLEAIYKSCGSQWNQFEFIKEDIRNLNPTTSLFSGIDYVLHHAAIASVPLSIKNPSETFENNVFGTELVLEAARRAHVKKVVIASSSAVYGDNTAEVKIESEIGNPLSPYANSKYLNERQALQLSKVFKIPTVALRYFNVYGSRQSTDGAYAAVIPAWKQAIQESQAPEIFGDGSQTRDFLHINDVVKANLISAIQEQNPDSMWVFNVGSGFSVTLLELFEQMKKASGVCSSSKPTFFKERQGDIKHSRSSIEKIRSILGYTPEVELAAGLRELFDDEFRERASQNTLIPEMERSSVGAGY